MAPHSSTLAWKIPWTEEPGRLQSIGLLRVRHDWATSLSLFHFHALEKEMATHSSVLAWRITGTGEPGGLPSMGSHRVRHDWSDLAVTIAWEIQRIEEPGRLQFIGSQESDTTCSEIQDDFPVTNTSDKAQDQRHCTAPKLVRKLNIHTT